MRRFLVVAAMLLTPLPVLAQRKVPRRPKLEAGVDTNDAQEYFALGVRTIEHDAEKAAAAFYWASRIDPTWADALYAQRVATQLSDLRRYGRYMWRNRKVRESPEMLHLDSLQYRALLLNPFFYRRFDRLLLTRYIEDIANNATRNGQLGDNLFVEQQMESYIARSGSAAAAWFAYSEGRFPDALRLYAKAIDEDEDDYGLHADRARIFVLMGAHDSALSEMTRVVDEMRKRDEKELVYFYESKALFEQSIGIIHEQMNDFAAAREAYGQALLENFGFYPAHARLARLLMQQGDTTGALNEMSLAVQAKGDDAGLRFSYGYMLLAAYREEEGAEQFRKAIEDEPYYAPPYQYLARVLDVHGKTAEAIDMYHQYLAHASRRDPNYAFTLKRIPMLQARLTAESGAPR